MADSTRTIDVLLKEVSDSSLRNRLKDAVQALRKQTKFGLVFEGHHPEVSRLPEVPIRKGSLVARRSVKGNTLYRVDSISGTKATCLPEELPDDEESELLNHALTLPLSDLVAARRFGDAIYPSLRLVDAIQRGGEKPWHVLLQGDNYHALQALGYTHAGKVDVIYIDPPYNTGAKDWRYNNDYVDRNDPWRHSKWLSFVEKRLYLAKKLLKADGVLVVTIDEHEVHHLGCLLEQVFPEAYRQMVTIVTNPGGVTQGRFSRVEEYALFCFRGNARVIPGSDDFLTVTEGRKHLRTPQWESLLRRGTDARREDRETMFYPVIIDPAKQAVVGAGEYLPLNQKPDLDLKINGFPVAWPIRSDLSCGRWKVGNETLRTLISKGFVKVGRFDPKRKTFGVTYLTRMLLQQLEAGILQISSKDETRNAVTLAYTEDKTRPPRTVWNRNLHNAGPNGTDLLRTIFGEGGRFPFPKSLYAVRDTLRLLVADKPNAVILDFFAGSGTTLHAVSLLNAVDGGNRKSIVITNNEVAEEDKQVLRKAKKKEGDIDWEEKGICRAVTWPRCKFVIQGKRDDGTNLPDNYFTGAYAEHELPRSIVHIGFEDGTNLDLSGRKDLARLIGGVPLGSLTANEPWHLEEGGKISILWDASKQTEWLEALADTDQVENLYIVTRSKGDFKKIAEALREGLLPLSAEREMRRPMADGFEENLAYFELGFLDPGDVARGKQFAAILPLLWMLSGAKGKCPKTGNINKWLIADDCHMAVLHHEELFSEFRLALEDTKGIEHVFLVTDSEDTFKEMRSGLRKAIRAHMLYSSYLRNFGINVGATS